MARLINIPKDVQVLIDAEERGDTLGPKAQAFLNQMRDKDLIRPIAPLENPNLARRNQPSGLSGFLGLDQPASGAEALGRFASDPENIEAGGKLAAEIGGSIGGLKGLGKLFPKSKFTAPFLLPTISVVREASTIFCTISAGLKSVAWPGNIWGEVGRLPKTSLAILASFRKDPFGTNLNPSKNFNPPLVIELNPKLNFAVSDISPNLCSIGFSFPTKASKP